MVSDQMTSAKFASGHEYLVSRDSSSQGDLAHPLKEFLTFFLDFATLIDQKDPDWL